MVRQAEVAIEMATVIVLVADVTAGVAPLDLEIARRLRACGKPVFLAVNKVDSLRREEGVTEFVELGFRQMFPIAAAHGSGVTELLNAATADFPAGAAPEEAPAPRIAIVGKPNAGKSSLINCILKSDRTIVSDVPGTTRDSVDVPFTIGDRRYVLIDTAGLRHRSRIRTSVDQFGLMRAERSIRECDVAVLVMDAAEGVTNQDKRIGGLVVEARRSCVILVNKWDLAAEEEKKVRKPERKGHKPVTFKEEYLTALRKELFFLDWSPVLFASAKTGANVSELFALISRVEQARQVRVDTPRLNQLLARALDSYPPPHIHGKRFKIFYAFQKPGPVPTFVLFVNDTRCLTPHYERFLVDRIRSVWEFTGSPVVFECRPRERKDFVKK